MKQAGYCGHALQYALTPKTLSTDVVTSAEGRRLFLPVCQTDGKITLKLMDLGF